MMEPCSAFRNSDRNEIGIAEFKSAKGVGVSNAAIGFCLDCNCAGGCFAGAGKRAGRAAQFLRTLRLLPSTRQRSDSGASDAAVRHARARDRSKNRSKRHRDGQRSRSIRPSSRARPLAKRSARARNDQPRRHFCSSRGVVRARRITLRSSWPDLFRPSTSLS